MIYIETKRLILRDWEQQDLREFQLMNIDPEVRRYFPDIMSFRRSADAMESMALELKESGLGLFAAALKHSNEFIGFIGVQYMDETSGFDFAPCYEIGWRLKQSAWGHGYATEGARAVLDYTRMRTRLPIYSFTSKLNLPSINVMEKIGLKKIEEFDHSSRLRENDPLLRHVLYQDVRS